jgi:hypothetical protein
MTLKRRDAAPPPPHPSVMVQTDASDHVSYMHGVGYSLFVAEHYVSLQATYLILHSGILKYRGLRDGGQTYSNVEAIYHQHHDI